MYSESPYLAPWRRPTIVLVVPAPLTLQTATTNYRLQTMSSILRKRRPAASGTGIGPSSCTYPCYSRIPDLIISHSEEKTVHRWGEDVTRHREGINRCVSSTQVMLGVYQCGHQTSRCAFLSSCAPASLTDLSQESKDVEAKLGELIPWLIKLKDSVTASVDGNHEEAERREKLTQYVSYPRCRPDPS